MPTTAAGSKNADSNLHLILNFESVVQIWTGS